MPQCKSIKTAFEWYMCTKIGNYALLFPSEKLHLLTLLKQGHLGLFAFPINDTALRPKWHLFYFRPQMSSVYAHMHAVQAFFYSLSVSDNRSQFYIRTQSNYSNHPSAAHNTTFYTACSVCLFKLEIQVSSYIKAGTMGTLTNDWRLKKINSYLLRIRKNSIWVQWNIWQLHFVIFSKTFSIWMFI